MEKIKRIIYQFMESKHTIFLWLFLLAIISFGILIPTLGFYWDDLPYLFQYSAFGPGGFPDYVSSDRPFSAWIFMTTTTLFGYNPLGYHILALTLRWLCASVFYLILEEIWPKNSLGNTIAAAVMVVYPGFLQQPIALIYNHHFSVLLMLLLSIYLMIRNAKLEKTNFLILIPSIALTFSMFSIENFAILELVRPIILWQLTKNETKEKSARFKKVLFAWTPYLAVLVFFLAWRVFIFKFPTYKPAGLAEIRSNPISVILSVFKRIPHDFYMVYIKAWFTSLTVPTVSDFGRTATYLFWLVIAASIFLSFFMYLQFFPKNSKKKHQTQGIRNARLEMLIGSLLLFLFAGAIVWGLDLPIENKFAWDRMTLAFIPSVALLIGFLFSCFNKGKIVRLILVTVLFTQAAGQNYKNEISFKRDWDNLGDFLSQLSWRVPSVTDNTIFLTSESGLNYYSDNSLTSPINLQYSDTLSKDELSHFVYSTNARTEEWFEDDEYNLDYSRRYRSFIFHGNTSNVLVYQFEPPGCVRLMDRTFSNSITIPNLVERQVKEIRFSNLGIITEKPEHEPFSLLFKESSTDSWCYYFEKADLARQFGNYEEVARLGDKAAQMEKYPRIPSEWLPFLEGYLWEGEMEKASVIIDEILKSEGNYESGMCYTLRRILRTPDFPFQSELEEIVSLNGCEK